MHPRTRLIFLLLVSFVLLFGIFTLILLFSSSPNEESSHGKASVLPELSKTAAAAAAINEDETIDSIVAAGKKSTSENRRQKGQEEGEHRQQQRQNNKECSPIPNPTRLLPATSAVTFNPLQPFYGLTNQMIAYAGAFRYAMDERRALLFPQHSLQDGLVPFHMLFNATLTFQILRSLAAIHPAAGDLFWALRSAEEAENVRRTVGASCSYEADRAFTSVARALPDSAFPFVSMNKKSMFLPERNSYRGSLSSGAVRGARVYMNRMHVKSMKRFPFIRHHNFFGRYPWAAAVPDNEEEGAAAAAGGGGGGGGGAEGSPKSESIASASPLLHEAFFLNALQPTDAVERAWFTLALALKSAVTRRGGLRQRGFHDRAQRAGVSQFVRRQVRSLHLRIERDAKLLVDKLPTAEQVTRFLHETVVKRFGTERRLVVWISVGAWPSEEFEESVERYIDTHLNKPTVHIYWRGRLMRKMREMTKARSSSKEFDFADVELRLPRAVGRQRKIHRSVSENTQDHFRSFVDLLFLARARTAILSAHSSLKFVVFAKRCYADDVNSGGSSAQLLKFRRKLESVVPEFQRFWTTTSSAGEGDETGRSEAENSELYSFSIDKQSGQMSAELQQLRCSERARGWAGHRSWST